MTYLLAFGAIDQHGVTIAEKWCSQILNHLKSSMAALISLQEERLVRRPLSAGEQGNSNCHSRKSAPGPELTAGLPAIADFRID
jgi:hypothetical protein